MAQNSRRGRGNRRRQGGSNNPNRSMDSQGPEVKIRGTAQQIYDKYVALARDAFSAGDRIRGESLQQHAEHYYRLLKSMQPADKRDRDDDQADDDRGGQSEHAQQPSIQEDRQPATQADEPPEKAAVEKDTDEAAAAAEGEDDSPKARRSRRRRARRGEEGEGEEDGGSASSSGEGEPAPKKRASRSRKKQEEADEEVSAA